MARFTALLRGINVGTAKRVAMADLRALLVDHGWTDVKTLLNSGNVVLTGAADAAAIEKAITAGTGLEVRCVLRTADELQAILDGNPFAAVAGSAEKGGSRMMAHVLGAEPEPDRLAAGLALDPDRAAAGPGVIYQWCPDGQLEAPPVTAKLGVLVTARNWNTITKLSTLLAA